MAHTLYNCVDIILVIFIIFIYVDKFMFHCSHIHICGIDFTFARSVTLMCILQRSALHAWSAFNL